ncbi:uncharacterized protein LOC144882686 [Branchiostoma floridae x Branchiostoma japonicum]
MEGRRKNDHGRGMEMENAHIICRTEGLLCRLKIHLIFFRVWRKVPPQKRKLKSKLVVPRCSYSLFFCPQFFATTSYCECNDLHLRPGKVKPEPSPPSRPHNTACYSHQTSKQRLTGNNSASH